MIKGLKFVIKPLDDIILYFSSFERRDDPWAIPTRVPPFLNLDVSFSLSEFAF